MPKITILEVKVSNAKRDGTAYLDQKGEAYSRVLLRTKEYPKVELSGIAYPNSPVLRWKAGDMPEVEVEQKGDWLNFRLPRKNNQALNDIWAKLNDLETRLKLVEDEGMRNMTNMLKANKEMKENPIDIPF